MTHPTTGSHLLVPKERMYRMDLRHSKGVLLGLESELFQDIVQMDGGRA